MAFTYEPGCQPPKTMMVFHMLRNADKLEKAVYSVPEDVDQEIARIKLAEMDIQIDTLTAEQEQYLNSWEEGT